MKEIRKRMREVTVKTLAIRFLRDESGTSPIEYALIAAGIGVVIVTIVNNMGSSLKTSFTTLLNLFK